ncbi:MAG: hypothetical protein JSS76_19690 [Bacteroidetes bacterium]|nr:hypothetical protein [Bacteroidota bacterium]
MKHSSLLAFCICCIVFFFAPFLTKRWNNTGSNTVISWDIYGYWLYLPAFFYDDLGRLDRYDYIQETYHPASDTKDQAFIHPETGRYVMNYPCGMAVMALPAFAIGHITAQILGYKADGFTLPFQLSLIFWCVIVSCLGIWILRKLLLKYFDEWIVALVLIIVSLGTNYLNFVVFSPMTHAFLFTVYAYIIYLTDLYWSTANGKLRHVILIGLLCGLATITRPTDIICILIPLLWGVSNADSLLTRIKYLFTHWRVPILFAFAALFSALPQLLYWKHYAGHWIFFSYHGDDKTFSFAHPHVIEVLFSYKKGWFSYTPVMILSVVGIYHLYRYHRQIFWVVGVFTVLNIYLISAWDCWWYGGSFSMRPMIDSYPLLMFPLASLMDSTLRSRFWRYPVSVFLMSCLCINILFINQSNGILGAPFMDEENTTKAYYWRTLGKVCATANDKKLLDTDEEMPGRLEPTLQDIYHIDLDQEQQDSLVTIGGRRSLVLNGWHQWSGRYIVPPSFNAAHGWYRVYATIYYPVREWNVWHFTQLCFGFYKGERPVKEKLIRLERITGENRAQEVYVDLKAPDNMAYDSLVVHLWHADSQRLVYVSDIRIAYTPGE